MSRLQPERGLHMDVLAQVPKRFLEAPDTVVEEITPEKAASFLLLNHENNRRQRPGVVEMLAAQMMSGEWMLTHQGIAFDVDGKLIDGAHRLNAIIASGVTVRIMVTRGVTDASCIDSGTRRNINDRLALDGKRRTIIYTSILRGMFSFDANRLKKITPGKFALLEETYRQELEFMEVIYDRSNGRRVLVGASLAPGARALHYHPAKAVDTFYEILCTGIMRDPSQNAPATLRTWLTGKGNFPRQEIYRKTETALHSFLNGRPLNKVYAAKQELFPLPDGVYQ
jgi:hypothetical protein